MSPINAFICNVIKHVCDVITIRETELKDKRGLLPRIHFELLCLLRQVDLGQSELVRFTELS